MLKMYFCGFFFLFVPKASFIRSFLITALKPICYEIYYDLHRNSGVVLALPYFPQNKESNFNGYYVRLDGFRCQHNRIDFVFSIYGKIHNQSYVMGLLSGQQTS